MSARPHEQPIADASPIVDGLMSAADKAKLNQVVADWSVTGVRYYAVDTGAGDDARQGYSDVNMATAGTVALKTLARLLTILPPVGAGRAVVIAVKTGTYAESLRFVGYVGYRHILWRSTTDFSNTTTDKINCSSTTFLAGPAGGGAFAVNAAPAPTLNTFTVVAGTLTAEPALLGCRVRFLTGARAGEVSSIQANTSGQVTLLDDLTGAPAAGDTFVIEDPGVTVTGGGVSILFGGSTALGDVGLSGNPHTLSALSVIGFSFTASEMIVDGDLDVNLSFVKSTGGLFGRRALTFSTNTQYRDEGIVLRTTGAGFYGTSMEVQGCVTALLTGAARGASFTVRHSKYVQVYGYFGASSSIVASGGAGPDVDTGFGVTVGVNLFQITGRRNTRLAGLLIQSSAVQIGATTMEGPGITVKGSAVVSMDGAAGSIVGGPGVTVIGTKNILMMGIIVANTLTGDAGDILLPGSVVVKHADLVITNVIGPNGNYVIGSAGEVVGVGVVLTNVDGTGLAVGEIVRVSTAGNVVRAQADTIAHASTGLMVSVTSPANNGAGLFVPLGSPQKWILHNAAPTLNALSYLYPTTAGLATTTIPLASGTNQKRRLGHVLRVSGNRGLVVGTGELIPTSADSLA